MQNATIVTIGEVEFSVPKWSIQDILEKQPHILPIISEPVQTAIAYSKILGSVTGGVASLADAGDISGALGAAGGDLTEEDLERFSEAFAAEEDGAQLFVARMLGAVMDALAQANMLKTIPIILDGVSHRNANGVKVITTLKSIEEMGLGLGELYLLLAAVLKNNLKDLLKKDFRASLSALLTS